MILMSNLLFRKVVLLALTWNVCLQGWRCSSSLFVDASTGKAANDDSNSHRRIKGRKLSDAFYEWRNFDRTFTEAQNRKKQDSQEDSVRYCEKLKEKKGITCTPSSQPSSLPSQSPTVSMAPSLSVAPSDAPSDVPSSLPTSAPSKPPTGLPSSTPSKLPTGQPSVPPSGQPSVPPTVAPTPIPFETLFLTREDGSQWQDNTCQTTLPAEATQLQTEETRFEYFLYLKIDAEPDVNMKDVEQSLATAMADEILTCQFDGSNTQYPFETYSFTSLPADERGDANGCPDNVKMDGTDCYVIKGGFTPTLFYLEKRIRERQRGRRQLSINRSFSSQSQSEIVEVFGPILQSLLDSNAFVSGDILKTTYSGFLLGNTQGSGSSGSIGGASTFDTTTTVAIQGNSNNNKSNNDGGTPTGFVFGAIAICVAVTSLIIVSAVLLRRRRDAKIQEAFELCDEDGQLDPSDEIDPQAMPNQYDTRSVLQEGFPGDNTTYDHAAPAPIQDVEPTRVQQSKPYSSGRFGRNLIDDNNNDDEDFSVEEARRAVVVNDEATFDESVFDLESSAGNDPHDYKNCKSPTCFKCRSRNMKKPTFVQADLQAIQSDLGSNKKYRPKYNRQYAADDTVNL